MLSRSLCARLGKDWSQVQRALFGVSDDIVGAGSVWARAVHYYATGSRSVLAAMPEIKFPGSPLTEEGHVRKRSCGPLHLPLPKSRNLAAWICVLRDLKHLRTSDWLTSYRLG